MNWSALRNSARKATDDSPHYEFVRAETSLRQGLKNAHHVEQNWVDDFHYMREAVEWGVLTYTCHPFISGRGHRIMVLERMIQQLKNEGAVFMLMGRCPHDLVQRAR